MKCVADENVDSSIVRALRDHDHEVWYVAEEAGGIEDDEVLAEAARENALLLTADKDFGELVFRHGTQRYESERENAPDNTACTL